MKWTIKAGLTRTYALRQYENIKPMIEIEMEYDSEKDDIQKILESMKIKCEDYIKKFDPRPEDDDSQLPF